MDSGSVLETEIDNSGNSDKLVVTRDVHILSGTVKAIPTETITQSRQYTILEADNVSGEFDSLDVLWSEPSALLGARVTRELILGSSGRTAIVQGRARWVHEFGDVTSGVDARFEDVPSVWFTVSDEEVSRDSFLLGAGFGFRLGPGLRAFVDYDASLNPDNTARVISGSLEYRW